MRGEEIEALVEFCVLVVVVMAAGAWATYKTQDRAWKQEAIQHNAAEYDTVIGEWRWKEPKKASPK